MSSGTGRVQGRGKAGAVGIVGAVALVMTALALALAVGCGQAPAVTGTIDTDTPAATSSSITPSTQVAPVTSSTTAPGAAPSSTGSSAQLQPSAMQEVFGQLASSVRPMTVFTPGFLPEGAVMLEQWLPVIEAPHPEAYTGPAERNPRVVGSGASSEIQVVYRVGAGWLVIMENFQGDVGDVTGSPVGSVAGNDASLFEVNGGVLVQWSLDGLWYGVFGRGVERDAILATALGMKVLLGEAP